MQTSVIRNLVVKVQLEDRVMKLSQALARTTLLQNVSERTKIVTIRPVNLMASQPTFGSQNMSRSALLCGVSHALFGVMALLFYRSSPWRPFHFGLRFICKALPRPCSFARSY